MCRSRGKYKFLKYVLAREGLIGHGGGGAKTSGISLSPRVGSFSWSYSKCGCRPPPSGSWVAGLSGEAIKRREGNVFSGRGCDRRGRVGTDAVDNTDLGASLAFRTLPREECANLIRIGGVYEMAVGESRLWWTRRNLAVRTRNLLV